jgi:hypothetical protein
VAGISIQHIGRSPLPSPTTSVSPARSPESREVMISASESAHLAGAK